MRSNPARGNNVTESLVKTGNLDEAAVVLGYYSHSSCARCGLSTTVPSLLVRRKRFYRSVQLLCPPCAARLAARLYPTKLLFPALLIGYFTVSWWNYQQSLIAIRRQFAALKLHTLLPDLPFPIMVPIFYATLFVVPTVLVLATLLAAWLTRMRLFEFQFGIGRLLLDKRFRNAHVVVRLLPSAPAATFSPPPARCQRWRFGVVWLTPLVLLVSAMALVINLAGYDRTGRIFLDWGWGMLLALGILLFLNLVPWSRKVNGVVVSSTLTRLRKLYSTPFKRDVWVNRYELLDFDHKFGLGQVDQAKAVLEAATAAGHEWPQMRYARWKIQAATAQWSALSESTRKALDETKDLKERASICTWAALATAYSSQNPTDADAFCRETMEAIPWNDGAQVIRAIVLLIQHKTDEAEAILNRRQEESSNFTNRALTAHGWAEIYRRKGNSSSAEEWQHRAEALDPVGAFRFPQRATAPGYIVRLEQGRGRG
jgi:hypothetical protein